MARCPSRSSNRILRDPIRHVRENGLEVEIVGEIAKMVELGIGNKGKRAILDETMIRSVKVVAGARNQRYLHLDHAIL